MLKPQLIVFALALTLAGCALPRSPEDTAARAIRYAKNGDYEQALIMFREAERENPADAVLLSDMSFLYSLMNDYPACIEYARRSLAIRPAHAATERTQAVCYLASEDVGEAARILEQVRTRDTHDFVTLGLLVRAYHASGALALARERLRELDVALARVKPEVLPASERLKLMGLVREMNALRAAITAP